MPLKTIRLRPGIFRENTRYTAEGGWYFCDKIRFRGGQPEKIGGWQQISPDQFLGICRSLWPWQIYLGVGTNLKYYVYYGGYYDITPLRTTTTLPLDPFTANGTTLISVNAPAHGALTGDFVTFSGATAFNGVTISGEFQITVIDANTYTFVYTSTVSAGSGGGAAVSAAYQVNVGSEIEYPVASLGTGWGQSGYGSGVWGGSTTPFVPLQIGLWNAYNFGEDLIFGPKGGGMYYWDSSLGLGFRGVNITSLPGASDVPTVVNFRMVSDASRIVLAFGTNDYGGSSLNPMLIRWSEQESAVNWTPAATNQAGSLLLSHGSKISAVAQTRQEILVWTDVALYSMQYIGPPIVWSSQILADNISIASDRAWATAAGVTYWMGDEKFYLFDGRVQTLNCDIRKYIFDDFNTNQYLQVFASTVEQFSEVWWFYCSKNSNTIDKYVVYNYAEKIWYYGTMARTAWQDDSVISNVPIAADYNGRVLYHETGCDDAATATPVPIDSYITSSEFDIDDGHNFGFIWRVIPDVTFDGSTTVLPTQPNVNFSILTLQNSGSGYTRGVTPVATSSSNMSVGGTNSATVTREATTTVERFTQQINLRVRARQMAIKVASNSLGTQWQLGAPRIDIRQDGRKS